MSDMPQAALLYKIPSRSEFRMALTLAVALLFAQFGAMAHAYSHDGATGATGAAVAREAAAPQTNLGSHEFCGECLSFAPLLSASGAPHALPFILPQGLAPDHRAVHLSQIDYRPLLAFRSRAPPVAQ